MDALKNFTEKDMLEQMVILEEIKETGQKEAIPEMFELLAGKKCDQATHEMLYHTLFELMEGEEEAIKTGISHPSFRVKLLSIRRCRKSGLTSVVPLLIETLQTTTDTEITGEIIMALGSFKDPALINTLRPFLFHPEPSIVSWTMEALAGLEDDLIKEIMMDLIKDDEKLTDQDKECNLSTILAVQYLAKTNDPTCRDFLLANREHPDRAFRKAVKKALESL